MTPELAREIEQRVSAVGKRCRHVPGSPEGYASWAVGCAVPRVIRHGFHAFFAVDVFASNATLTRCMRGRRALQLDGPHLYIFRSTRASNGGLSGTIAIRPWKRAY